MDKKFEIIQYRQFASIEARELRLDQCPAVYAWYRNLRFGEHIETPNKFLAKIDALLTAKLSDEFSGKLGPLYNVTIQEASGHLTERKQEVLKKLAKEDETRVMIANILESVTFLQAPLYIGKTMNLQQRIGEHVTGQTNLLDRLAKAGIEMDQCILKFSYFHNEQLQFLAKQAKSSEDLIVLLIEDLFTKLAPASFVRRVG
jgi:hypothetical protein